MLVSVEALNIRDKIVHMITSLDATHFDLNLWHGKGWKFPQIVTWHCRTTAAAAYHSSHWIGWMWNLSLCIISMLCALNYAKNNIKIQHTITSIQRGLTSHTNLTSVTNQQQYSSAEEMNTVESLMEISDNPFWSFMMHDATVFCYIIAASTQRISTLQS